MIDVFFSGHGEWFIKDSNGQSHPHSDLVCYIEFDSYNRCWNRTYPYNSALGFFMLTEEDEIQCNKKEQKHKNQDIRFDKFNLNFVNTLQPLPVGFSQCDAVQPPESEIESGSEYFFKIRKYKNADRKLEDRLDYILNTGYFDEPGKAKMATKAKTTAKTVTTQYNPNKSNDLSNLNQASALFWSNADESDKSTWPDTKDIVSWLQEREFSLSLARSAASIIRPKWAVPGRKPFE